MSAKQNEGLYPAAWIRKQSFRGIFHFSQKPLVLLPFLHYRFLTLHWLSLKHINVLCLMHVFERLC